MASGRKLAINRYLPPLERELNRVLPGSDPSPLGQPIRYAMFPAGKRIRPLLCIAAYRACGGRTDSEILPFACGIELVHAFSLIQDDLPCMDDDALRRGRPALHAAYGQDVALLASDAMFALAFELGASSTVSPSRRLRAIRELARAAGRHGIVEGQLADIDHGRPRDARALRRIHLQKTACLIAASLSIGAIAAGASRTVSEGLARAGRYLGMLFQITDDLLDVRQERNKHEASGRRRRVLGPLTYPGFYGRTGAELRARGYLDRYRSELRRLAGRLAPSGTRELLQVGEFVLNRQR